MFFCAIANDDAIAIPAWMFDRAACSQLTLGPPLVSVAALLEVRNLIDGLRTATSVMSSGTVALEESDETNIPKASTGASDTTVDDRVSEKRRTGTKAKGRNHRAPEPTTSTSRKGGQRKRGG